MTDKLSEDLQDVIDILTGIVDQEEIHRLDKIKQKLQALEADNERLKEYVQHKSGCNYSPEYLTNQPCTCGLELKDQS